jgi:hypothetical protein
MANDNNLYIAHLDSDNFIKRSKDQACVYLRNHCVPISAVTGVGVRTPAYISQGNFFSYAFVRICTRIYATNWRKQ